MKNLNLSISNELFGKLVGAATVLGHKDAQQAAEVFLNDSADIVLNGHYYEIEDEKAFHRLQREAKLAKTKN